MAYIDKIYSNIYIIASHFYTLNANDEKTGLKYC